MHDKEQMKKSKTRITPYGKKSSKKKQSKKKKVLTKEERIRMILSGEEPSYINRGRKKPSYKK